MAIEALTYTSTGAIPTSGTATITYSTSTSDTALTFTSTRFEVSSNFRGAEKAMALLDGSVLYSNTTQTSTETKTRTFARGTSEQIKVLELRWVDGADMSSTVLANKYVNIVIPALEYTVKYDANGGTGAPASQQKAHGQTLTLSSTEPTRTGYTFKSWNTSKDGTGTSYQPGGSYTANAAATLYAQWDPETYTISFDANGGKNAPASVTKTYGRSLTLPSEKPNRVGHTFVGWGEEATSTVAKWFAGGSFSDEITSSKILYAVWHDDYEAPVISVIDVYRCDEDGNEDEESTYASISADWYIDTSVDEDVVNTATVTGTISSERGGTQPITFDSETSGTEGTATAFLSDLDPDTQYTVRIIVTDIKSATTRNAIILRAFYIMDFGSQGRAVGIGRAAPEEGLEIGYVATFDADVNMYSDLTVEGEVTATDSAGSLHLLTHKLDRLDMNLAGLVVPYAGSVAPSGYLMCDGASYLREDYPLLFAAIGTTYGAADATHFNVPDYRGRTLIGTSSSHALGSTGGSETHKLTEKQIPSHKHSVGAHKHTVPKHGHGFTQPTVNGGGGTNNITGGSHYHRFGGNRSIAGWSGNSPEQYVTLAKKSAFTGNGQAQPYVQNDYDGRQIIENATHTHSLPGHTHSVSGGAVSDKAAFDTNDSSAFDSGATGGSEAHNIMQPYSTVNWIISTGGEPVAVKAMKGDKGDTGDQGPQGIQGDKGDQGPQGIQGDKGDKGDKGDTGDVGNVIHIGADEPDVETTEYWLWLSPLDGSLNARTYDDGWKWQELTFADFVKRAGDSMTGNLLMTSPDITSNVTVSENNEGKQFCSMDSTGTLIGRINPIFMPNGNQYMRYVTARVVGGTERFNILDLGLDASGNALVSLTGTNAAASWRSAIGAFPTSGGLVTGDVCVGGVPVCNGSSGPIGVRLYTDGEGGNISWTAKDGSYNEIDSYNNTHTRIYNYYQGAYHSVSWQRSKNYNLDNFMLKTGDAMTGNLTLNPNNCIIAKRNEYSAAGNPSGSLWLDALIGQDSTGAGRFNLRQVAFADGYQGVQLEAHRIVSGTNHYNGIRMEINGSGAKRVIVTDASIWRSAIGAAASSDRRLKSDVSSLGDDAVEFVRKLEPCVYTINGERQVGLIAQDVHEADLWGTRMAFETQEGIDGLDDWEKMEDGSPTWKLDYIRLLPPVITALQREMERNDALEKRVADLEAKISGKEV